MNMEITSKPELGSITINDLVQRLRVALRENMDFNFTLNGIEHESYYFSCTALYLHIQRELEEAVK